MKKAITNTLIILAMGVSSSLAVIAPVLYNQAHPAVYSFSATTVTTNPNGSTTVTPGKKTPASLSFSGKKPTPPKTSKPLTVVHVEGSIGALKGVKVSNPVLVAQGGGSIGSLATTNAAAPTTNPASVSSQPLKTAAPIKTATITSSKTAAPSKAAAASKASTSSAAPTTKAATSSVSAPQKVAATAPTTTVATPVLSSPVAIAPCVWSDITLSSAATAEDCAAIFAAANYNVSHAAQLKSLGSSLSFAGTPKLYANVTYNGTVIFKFATPAQVTETVTALDKVYRDKAPVTAPCVVNGVTIGVGTQTDCSAILAAANDAQANASSYKNFGGAVSVAVNADGSKSYSYNDFEIYSHVFGDYWPSKTIAALDQFIRDTNAATATPAF